MEGNEVDSPTTTVGRELEDLAMIRVISRELDTDDEVRQTTPYKWRLKDDIAWILESSELMETIKAC